MAAYQLAICEVTNPNDNFKEYARRSAGIVEKYGGEYVVRGPAARILKGEMLTGKVIIITKWASLEDFDKFYSDEEYQSEVAPLREGTGNYEFAIYESPD